MYPPENTAILTYSKQFFNANLIVYKLKLHFIMTLIIQNINSVYIKIDRQNKTHT